MPRYRDKKWPVSQFTKFPRRLREFQKLGSDVCWDWPGRLNEKGYGAIGGKTTGLSSLAHKRAWQILRGPVPGGMQLDHLCLNKRCCNPAHMEVVTPTVNMRRSLPYRTSQYAPKSHCRRGHLQERDKAGKAKCSMCRKIRLAHRSADTSDMR